MIVLKTGQLNELQCRIELDEFKNLLLSNVEIGETTLLNFFESRAQLILLMGRLIGVGSIASYNSEIPIIGKYRADFVVSNKDNSEFAFIEFENATLGSIFTRRLNKKTHAYSWSARFEHGYSQVIDWYHHLLDNEGTNNMLSEFGHSKIKFYGALIIGRDSSINKSDCRERFNKRVEGSRVYNKGITCFTFDELYKNMEDEYDLLCDFK